jgi:hypothetical protein
MITISGQNYPVKTGYGAIYLFCTRKGIEFHEFLTRIQNYDFAKINNELIDDLAELMLCFIERGGGDCHLSKLDIVDWIGEGNTEVVFKLLTESVGVSKNRKAVRKKAANSTLNE